MFVLEYLITNTPDRISQIFDFAQLYCGVLTIEFYCE